MFGDFYDDDDDAGYCNVLEMMTFGSKDFAEEATALLELERGGGRRQHDNHNHNHHQQHRRSRDDDDDNGDENKGGDNNNKNGTCPPTGGAAEASSTHPCVRATSFKDQNPDCDEARATQCLLSTVSEMGGPLQIAVRVDAASEEWRRNLRPILGDNSRKRVFYQDVRRKLIESGALVRVTVQGRECYKLSGWATSAEFTPPPESTAARKEAVEEVGLERGSRFMCTNAGCKMVFTCRKPWSKHAQEVHGENQNSKHAKQLFRQFLQQHRQHRQFAGMNEESTFM